MYVLLIRSKECECCMLTRHSCSLFTYSLTETDSYIHNTDNIDCIDDRLYIYSINITDIRYNVTVECKSHWPMKNIGFFFANTNIYIWQFKKGFSIWKEMQLNGINFKQKNEMKKERKVNPNRFYNILISEQKDWLKIVFAFLSTSILIFVVRFHYCKAYYSLVVTVVHWHNNNCIQSAEESRSKRKIINEFLFFFFFFE